MCLFLLPIQCRLDNTATALRYWDVATLFRSSTQKLGDDGDNPQKFSHAPCLRDASAGPMRLVAIEDLTDAPHPGLYQVSAERDEQAADVCSVPIHPVMSAGIVSEQPGPDCALMIGRVAFGRPAGISAAISGILVC